ncbi:hypothetical protein [uncultured Pseudomonas sp.]|uniref:hypothetical protein n=1 Tax=uncultured Pseudomonas sp. TaxID=114707 RepID=UPI0026161647|nr:hypothetical protein [uncultured Pseudomonas sp.]
MEVKPIGEAVFEVAGQTYRISASELKQQGMEQNSNRSHKSGTDAWSVSFTAEHELGQFTWLVSYSLGDDGASVDDFMLVKQPAGLEVDNRIRFELVEDDE